MWRHDAGRSAVSKSKLPDQVQLQWTRELGEPVPAWPQEQDYHGKLEFDRAYQPIVVGNRVIVPSMVSDSVTAYDTSTGEELWRFYADGPVRFAPVGDADRVYFASDDGHLYCVATADGALEWKVRGGPDDRAILGNQRLTSAWPARGAPVLADGHVYFGAGIWPFMGIFIHAVDAKTGETVWTNSGTGAIYNLHQHGGADAFGGIAPQGYMAVAGDHLVVAGGLTVPAIFDRHTGDFLSFEQSHAAVGKGTGGFNIAAAGDYYFNAGRLFAFEDGMPRVEMKTDLPLLAEGQFTILQSNKLISYPPELQSREVEVTDRRGAKSKQTRYSLEPLRQAPIPVATSQLLLQADDQFLVLLADGQLASLRWVDATDGGRTQLEVVWQQAIDGTVDHALVADDRLFVVTHEGQLHCLGAVSDREPTVHRLSEASPAADDRWTDAARQILDESGKRDGIAVVWGLDQGRLIDELIARSNLLVVAVDDDAQRVEQLRQRFDEAQLYGRRVHILESAPHRLALPPYLAQLVVSERWSPSAWQGDSNDDSGQSLVAPLFRILRPYGGTAWLTLDDSDHSELAAQVSAGKFANAEFARRGDFTTLTRAGALPGAGQWTHQYGNSANTVSSGDQLVKAPLGLLWFGGPTNHHALPRHAQGPVPQVAAGRLFIEGVNSISGRCVYTGRTLWIREFPDIGFPYKSNNHTFTGTVYINNQPGANFIGSNYVSLADAVYVVYQNECHKLDPETGETQDIFRLPPTDDSNEPSAWGYIGAWGDYLIAGASPQIFDDSRIGERNWNATSSKHVMVLDRHTGELLWSREATHGFRHNAIVPVANRLYLIDRLSDGAHDLLARRGQVSDEQARLSAHDLKTGNELWSTSEDIFGTWLGYSTDYDVLVQGGRTGGRTPLPDEPSKRIITYDGATGKVLWDEPISYTGPLVIVGDQIISSGRKDGAVHLLTGQPLQRLHPITGEELPWTHTRTYGCGSVLACDNLLTFRSGAAGFFDFGGDGGTGNLGGFKAGCTPNLVPADGVLNAPDYTRTCSCAYQNQTSLAMVHQPDIETWTYSTLPAPKKDEVVRRVGINLNAPGDRQAADGTLWLEYPSIAGPSPDIPVAIEQQPDGALFRKHSLLLHETDDAQAPRWVAASGMEGVDSVTLTLHDSVEASPKSYTVRLHFLEPFAAQPGQRVVDVSLQGEKRETGLDVAEQSGGPLRPLVREYSDVTVTDKLTIELHPTASRQAVLSGIEVIAAD